jgi:hypothetical protein
MKDEKGKGQNALRLSISARACSLVGCGAETRREKRCCRACAYYYYYYYYFEGALNDDQTFENLRLSTH